MWGVLAHNGAHRFVEVDSFANVRPLPPLPIAVSFVRRSAKNENDIVAYELYNGFQTALTHRLTIRAHVAASLVGKMKPGRRQCIALSSTGFHDRLPP